MQHPDEGTIHAWLDGALPPAEASALEAHAASCAGCSAAVAEARGMLAAASRILSALDDVPGGVIPAAADATWVAPGRRGVAEVRPFRFRAARWQVAAGLMIAVAGSWLVMKNDGTRDMIEIKGADTSVAAPATMALSQPDTLSGNVERVAEAAQRERPRAGRPGSRTETSATASVGTAVGTGAGSVSGAVASDVAAALQRREVASGRSVSAYAQEAQAPRADAAARTAFDSLLAIDSAQTVRGAMTLNANVVVAEERVSAAGVAKSRSAAPSSVAPPPAAVASPAPAAAADMAVGALRQESVSVAIGAAGCYALTVVGWSPVPADSVVRSVVPQRFVLDRPSGAQGNSPGPWVARPVAADGGVAPAASGSWSLLGTEQLRVRFGRDGREAVLTLARSIGGWRGVARLSAGADGPVARGDVIARRVTCEPASPER